MTSRERLLTVFASKIPDKVPVSPFIQEQYLSYYYGKQKTDRLIDAYSLAEALDFDLISKSHDHSTPYFLKRSFPNWELSVRSEVKGENFYKYIEIRTPEGVLIQKEGASHSGGSTAGLHLSTLEYLIKDEDDFLLFKKYMPPMDMEEKNDIKEKARFAKKYIKTRGITAPWSIASVFNLVCTYMDVQDVMVDALVNEDYYSEYMKFFSDIVLANHEAFAESDYDCVGIQGNIANGSMFGADFFDKYVLPYEKPPIDLLNQASKPTIYHNCGKANALYPSYKKLGISAWETIAAPPQGDNDIKNAKEYFGKSLILIGSLDQVNFLKTANPAEVFKRTEEIVHIGKKDGAYIFSASDFLESETPFENLKAMIEGARQAGAY